MMKTISDSGYLCLSPDSKENYFYISPLTMTFAVFFFFENFLSIPCLPEVAIILVVIE